LHRDYLGSIVAISNQAGVVVEKRHFEAWGSLKNLEQNGVVVNITASNIYNVNLLLDRGYTGHEHLLKAGLIHMNGRLYDPALHRFLQPDNYVQDPSNTQNYNRYGYVLNNPLKYTDPTGEEFISLTTALIIAVSVAATTYTLGVMYGPGSFSFSGLFTTMIMAYTSCILTFGVGEAVGTIGNFWVKTAVSAVSHGTLQGGLSAIQGGNFWSGFASGSLSSVAASFWMGNGSSATNNSMSGGGRCFEGLATTAGITNQSASTILFGSIAGGVGARLSGGNFWQGAVTGGIVSGLNHALHDGGDDGNFLKKRDLTFEERQLIGKNYPNKNDYPDAESVYKLVGGDLYKKYLENPSAYENTCAIRLSIAFEKSKINIGGDYYGDKGLKYYTAATRIASAIDSRFNSYTQGYNISNYGVVLQYFDKSYTGQVFHVDIVYIKNGVGVFGNTLYGGKYNKFY
jgi:RHS repeat-associated protein